MSTNTQKCIRCAFRGEKNDPMFLGKNGKTYTKTCVSCREKKMEYTTSDIGDFQKCTDCDFTASKSDPEFIGKTGKVTKKCSDCREKCQKRDQEYRSRNPEEYTKHCTEVQRERRKRLKSSK